ncbi:arylsulfatase A-like enzyme [Algoriphagus ratkowskyi]|uniref:Sulfatase n=1 Tax=Algoriphagus ratkowskyi TaxID=57028 RepID=A0A2W7R3P6_9BACT|nr:sulfatase [Algoriphagus ratkowskyi]PZX55448.1 arylsulfatase A-like enzyme [Algoriphagus ratkowskyi]TXD79633.1 sulfatase [Algoriphagus ratkowskyi]
MKFFNSVVFAFLFTCLSTFAQQPNILWITIEDTSPQFIGSYGNENASTPVMDKFTKEGVQFTNAFSTGTVCSPSRTAIITGVKTYELGTGNHRSNYAIPSDIKGFPYYLQQAGYYTTNNSKTDYNVANEKAFIAEAWNESSGKAGWWDREDEQPFFAVFNYNESHQSRTMTNPYDWYLEEVLNQLPEEDRIGESEFEMPPFYRDSPEMRKQMARVYNSIKLTDNRIGELIGRLEADGLLDETIIFIFADHGEGMPRGKTNGINFGYRVPFTIWFPPKYAHLSPWKIGTSTDELLSFEDLAPTLISLVGEKVPGYLKGRVLLGDTRDDEVDKLFISSDRSDNGIDMVRTVTDGRYVYSRNYLPFMPEARYIRYMEIGEIKQLMRRDYENDVLNPLQKSLFEPRSPEVLYDIENDIWETNNLIDQQQHKALVEKMRTALESHIIESKDVLFLPEYELERISKVSTPYEFRQESSRYPIKDIYNVAKLAGLQGEKIILQQLDFLKSENDIERYWAALGLRSQEKELLLPFTDRIAASLDDTYPPAAITLAAVLYEMNQNGDAADLLKKHVLSSDKHLALMTINYLIYSDHKSPFIKVIEKVYRRENDDYNTSAASKDFLGSLGMVPNNFDYK